MSGAQLVAALTARGVAAEAAAELVAGCSAARIQTKLEVFDWLLQHADKRVGRNPVGYLVASIRSNYQAPADYQTAAAKEQAKAAARVAEEAQRRASEEARAEEAWSLAREVELRAVWNQLAEEDRAAIEAEVRAANPGLVRFAKLLLPLCLRAMEERSRGGKEAPTVGSCLATAPRPGGEPRP